MRINSKTAKAMRRQSRQVCLDAGGPSTLAENPRYAKRQYKTERRRVPALDALGVMQCDRHGRIVFEERDIPVPQPIRLRVASWRSVYRQLKRGWRALAARPPITIDQTEAAQ